VFVIDTIDKFHVLEWLDKQTNINHSIHKRVWPTAQRDSILLSHIRQIDDKRWMVWNHSVDHDADPKASPLRRTRYGVVLALALRPWMIECNGCCSFADFSNTMLPLPHYQHHTTATTTTTTTTARTHITRANTSPTLLQKYVRLTADVALVVTTVIAEGAVAPYSRADITSEITYFASINPGGWAPPSVVWYVYATRSRRY